MTIFPGCKCCGPGGPCWRCYGKELDCDAIVPYWDNIIPDNYKNAFRLSSPSVDSDARPPIEQTDKRLAWGDPLFLDDHATYQSNYDGTIIEFYVGNGYSDIRLRQFSLTVTACIKKDGVLVYRLQFNNFSGESNNLTVLKHISTDGTETVLPPGLSEFDLPMDSDSPFFLGQYVTEYFDGRQDVIELKSGYQILNNISQPVEHKCFETPPTESGWTPVGDCHKTEDECKEECGPCWRCYRSLADEVCKENEVAIQIKILSVIETDPNFTIDTSASSGLLPGAVLTLNGISTNGSACIFQTEYRSPNAFPVGDGSFASIAIRTVKALGGIRNQLYDGSGVIKVEPDYGVKAVLSPGGSNLPDWEDTSWTGFGTHELTAPIIIQIPPNPNPNPVQVIGKVVFEVAMIDLSGDNPDIPKDFYKHQCFDAPPTEEGWTPVGDCHPDEESCAKECPPKPPYPYTTGCCAGGILIRCVDLSTGLEIDCPPCGDPEWGYEIGDLRWTCWEEPDFQWCQDEAAADPSSYRFLDDYCNTAFYSDHHFETFPIEDCPETAAFYGPDPFSSCITKRRDAQTPTGTVGFEFKPLPKEALERLKRDNPLP